MKYLTILFVLLLSVTVSAEQFYTAEDTCGIMVMASAGGHGLYVRGTTSADIAHMVWGDNKKHDTLKEYVTEINEVCDTAWSKHWVPLEELIDGEQYYRQLPKIDSVACRPDSVWENKTLMYFTPEEMDRIKKLID